jgi:3-dehydroquinate dehydratase
MTCRSRATSAAVAGIDRAVHEVATSKLQLADLSELRLSHFASSTRASSRISRLLELRELAKLAAPIIITMMCHQGLVITDQVCDDSDSRNGESCLES